MNLEFHVDGGGDSLSLDSNCSSLSDNNWEQLVLRHHMDVYGTPKGTYLKQHREAMRIEEDIKENESGFEDPCRSPSHGTLEVIKPNPPSTHPKSPLTKSRRFVDRIVDKYQNSAPHTPDSLKKKEQGSERLRYGGAIHKFKENDAIIVQDNEKCNNSKHYDEKIYKELDSQERIYDWHTSPLMPIALDGEDDTVVAGMDELLKKVEQYKESTRYRSGVSASSGHEEEEEMMTCYPLALRLLVQLHRDLRCPCRLHKAFYAGHCHPSAFNFAVVLSRIFTLFDSRIILLELLRAAAGSPSQKLICRMLKVHKQECTQRRKVETVAGDLLSQLNFAGQSPQQIRDRARATTISVADSERVRAEKENVGSAFENENPGHQLTESPRKSLLQFPGRLGSPRKSSLLVSADDIKRDMLSSPLNIQDVPDSTFPIMKPSEMIAGIEKVTQPLNIIIESDEDESGDESSKDNTNRGDSIRVTLKARFPGLHGDKILRRSDKGFTTASVRRRSTRLSAFGFHPQMLQMVFEEWLASIPWTVKRFKFAEKVLVKNDDSSLQELKDSY